MRKWGYRVRLYWCTNCNVPLRQRRCSRCGSEGRELSIIEPGDIRPAFNGDIDIIKEALLIEFGTDILLKELNIAPEATFLNKVPHYDDMKNVIVGGISVGRFFFDPKIMKWRWRLNSYSARVAIDYGLVKVFRRERVKPLEVLGDSDREGEQAVVTDSKGRIIALAIAKKGKFRVQTLLNDPGEVEQLKKRASFDDIIKCNDDYFRSLISRSIQHLALFSEKVKLPVVCSFSGGKDSLVALHLALQAGLEPTILFNDTGLELPPTIKNVELIVSKFNLKLLIASAGNAFWEFVDVFGPPARDYRWCCKVLKLSRIATVYKERFPNGALVIIGQRALESVDRSWSGRVWRNKWLPAVLNTSPIQEWDQLMIWMYIYRNKLPYNTLYDKGFDRIGCYLCPAANIAEYHIVSINYPELWKRWIKVLNIWKEKLNVGEEWVRYHLWRWLNPRAQGRRRLEIWLGIKEPSSIEREYRRRINYSVRVSAKGSNVVEVHIQPRLPLDSLKSQAKVIRCTIAEVSRDSIKLRRHNATLYFNGEKLLVEGQEACATAVSAIKAIFRWQLCISCKSCLIWCPNKAIVFHNKKLEVLSYACRSCGICLEVCPVADMLIKKVLIPLIFGESSAAITECRSNEKEILKAVNYYRALRKVEVSEASEQEPVYDRISKFFDLSMQENR